MTQEDIFSMTKESAIAELRKKLNEDLISEAKIRSIIHRIYTLENDLFEFKDSEQADNFLEQEGQKAYTIVDMQMNYHIAKFRKDWIKIINKITGRKSEPIHIAYTDIEEMIKFHARSLNNKIEDHITAIKADQRNEYLGNREAAEKFLESRSHRGYSLYEGILGEDVRNYISQVRKEIKDAEDQRIRKKREEREAKEQKEEAARKSWIENHGSDRLKTMLEEGYEYRMTYEQERCAAEYPEYELDESGEKFDWEQRANPSKNALGQAKTHKQHGGEVVWLKSHYEPGEAVIIKPEWSRYHLVKTI